VVHGRVTSAEGALTAQGTALTQVQSTLGGIGGNGANLIPAEYSAFDSTLPTINKAGSTSVGLEADALAYSTSLLKVTSNATVGYFYLGGSADWNLRLKPNSKYIFSFLAKADVAHSVGVRVRYVNAAGSQVEAGLGAVGVTTELARYSLVVSMPSALVDRAAMVLFSQNTAASGITWFDQFMLESQIGTNTTPSEFTAGPSARQAFAQATAISSLDTQVSQIGTSLTAQATKLDGVYLQVNPDLAGTTEGFAGSTQSLIGVWSEQSARIEDGVALGQRIDTVQVAQGETDATVQQTSSALASLDGKVSASWSVKLQVNSNGQYVMAGIGVGIENTDAGLQSQVLLSADRFAMVATTAGGTTYTPFVVQNGQVFINSAFIQNGTITNAMIGSFIQSTNYVAGSTGWKLDKNGSFEINGTVAGQGRMAITNRSVRVYDAGGVKRVQLGDLSE
jgi:hypothetical protein